MAFFCNVVNGLMLLINQILDPKILMRIFNTDETKNNFINLN